MTARDILFNFPEIGFLMLLLFPYFFGQFALMQHRNQIQSIYAAPQLLSQLQIPRSWIFKKTKVAGWTLIWILLCFAMMQPFGNIRYSPPPNDSLDLKSSAVSVPREIIFLVDTSASMSVPDGLEGQNRLESAEDIIEDMLGQLQGQTVSLYAFTSQLSAVVPPTLDYIFTRLSLKELSIDQGDVGGTRLAPVLEELQKLAYPEPSPKYLSIFLFSDGGDNDLENSKGEDKEMAIESILKAIPNPQQFHLHLNAIGLGSLKPQKIPKVTNKGKPVFSKLEPGILEKLAERGRGKYYQADNWTTWDLAQELTVQIKKDDTIDINQLTESRKVAEVQKEDVIADLYYQIPLGLALLFYFLNLLLPDVRRI